MAKANRSRTQLYYCDQQATEAAFRRSKTVELEMRPVHVRKESNTRGHLLVVMLAYLLWMRRKKDFGGTSAAKALQRTARLDKGGCVAMRF